MDLNSSHQISGDDSSANNIYLGTNNGSNVVQPDTFVTGEAVTYEVQPGKTALGGLTNGTTYYVIQDGGYAVQLASSYANAMADHPITLTPDRSSAGEAVSHELVPAPIGGLTSGQVYYVRNAIGDTFQLSATPTGPILSLNVGSPAGIKGMHSFHKAGIQFNSSSGGTQDLYINFTTNPAGNDELLGPGGVSLRTISPPPGNGISASSAEGGEGGLVASASPDAETNVTANVQAYVAALGSSTSAAICPSSPIRRPTRRPMATMRAADWSSGATRRPAPASRTTIRPLSVLRATRRSTPTA